MTNNEKEVLGLPIEDRRWPTNKYKNYTDLAIKDIEDFWDKEARNLDWYKSWDKVLEWKNPFAKWSRKHFDHFIILLKMLKNGPDKNA